MRRSRFWFSAVMVLQLAAAAIITACLLAGFSMPRVLQWIVVMVLVLDANLLLAREHQPAKIRRVRLGELLEPYSPAPPDTSGWLSGSSGTEAARWWGNCPHGGWDSDQCRAGDCLRAGRCLARGRPV